MLALGTSMPLSIIVVETKILILPYGAGMISGFFIPPTSTIILINPNGLDVIGDCFTIKTAIYFRLGINIIFYINNDKIISCNRTKKYMYKNPIRKKDIEKIRDSNIILNYNKIIDIIKKILL